MYISYQESGDDIDRDRKQRQQRKKKDKDNDNTTLTRKVAMTKTKLGNTDKYNSHQKSGDDKALVGHGVLAHCLVTALLNSRMNISSGIFNKSRMKGL